MKLRSVILFAAILVPASAAQADAGVGARVGTMGIGGDVGFDVAPTLSARVGYSAFSWARHEHSSDVSYKSKLKLSNFSGLLDWSPAPTPFRLTGGLVFGDNKYTLQSEGGTFTTNGHTYNSNDASLSGAVKPGRRLAPYLGAGYGNVSGKGVNFYFDLGVIFHGSPKATINASCGAALSAAACAQLQSDAADESRRLEDKLSKYKYYPVANIGITVGF